MIINPYRFGGAVDTGFVLDDYAGATAAYSLRELTTTSWNVGNVVIEARNSLASVDTFTSAEVFDGTLVTFADLGDGSATVQRWYDQSGNANNILQSSTNLQPQIVSGGVLLADGLKFDGTNDYFDCGFGHGATSSQSMFIVGSANNFQVRLLLDCRQANDNGLGLLFLGGINNFMRMHADATDVFTGVTVPNTQYLWSGIYGSSTATMFRDGTQTDTESAPSAMSANTTTYKIGRSAYSN